MLLVSYSLRWAFVPAIKEAIWMVAKLESVRDRTPGVATLLSVVAKGATELSEYDSFAEAGWR